MGASTESTGADNTSKVDNASAKIPESSTGTTKFRITELTGVELKALESRTGTMVAPAITRAFKGKYGAAILLSQFLYWTMKKKYENKDGWFFNTATQIEEQTGLSVEAQKTARETLIQGGYIEASKRHQGNRYHYRVNLAAVASLLIEDARMRGNSAIAGQKPRYADSSPREDPTLASENPWKQNWETPQSSLDEPPTLLDKIKDNNTTKNSYEEAKKDEAGAPTLPSIESEKNLRTLATDTLNQTTQADNQGQTDPTLAARTWLEQHTSKNFASWRSKDGEFKVSNKDVIKWHKELSDDYIVQTWELSKLEERSTFKFIDWMNGENNPPEKLRHIRQRLFNKKKATEAAAKAALPTFKEGDIIRWSGNPEIEFEVHDVDKTGHTLVGLELTYELGAGIPDYKQRRIETSECTLIERKIVDYQNLPPLPKHKRIYERTTDDAGDKL